MSGGTIAGLLTIASLAYLAGYGIWLAYRAHQFTNAALAYELDRLDAMLDQPNGVT